MIMLIKQVAHTLHPQATLLEVPLWPCDRSRAKIARKMILLNACKNHLTVNKQRRCNRVLKQQSLSRDNELEMKDHELDETIRYYLIGLSSSGTTTKDTTPPN